MSINENNQAMAQMEQWQAVGAGSRQGTAAAQVVSSVRPCPLRLSQQLPFLPDYYSFLPVAYDENEEEEALPR